MGKRKRDDPTSSHPTTAPSSASAPVPSRPTKLPRLPAGYTVTKRPLLRPPIPSPYSSQQKQIYVSASTPFMSAVKRATKLLDKADKRATQSALDTVRKKKDHGGGGKGGVGQQSGRGGGELDEAARLAARSQQNGEEDEGGEVVLRGTGRAVDKALNIGAWFAQREGYVVRIRTGSVGAVDDIVEPEDAVGEAGADGIGGEAQEVPSARLRWASTVEVAVSRA